MNKKLLRILLSFSTALLVFPCVSANEVPLAQRFLESNDLLSVNHRFKKLPNAYKLAVDSILLVDYPEYRRNGIADVGLPSGLPDYDQIHLPYIQHYFSAFYSDVVVIVLKVPDAKVRLFEGVPYTESRQKRGRWDYLVIFIESSPGHESENGNKYCAMRLNADIYTIDNVRTIKLGLSSVTKKELKEITCQIES